MERKKFLIMQFRPEAEVADDEYKAFLKYGELEEKEVERIRGENGFDNVNLNKYSAVLIGGSPYTVSDKNKTSNQMFAEEKLFELMRKIKETDFPYFGNCYGLGTMACACGGEVSKEKYGEDVGAITVKVSEEGKKDKLLKGFSEFRAFVGHKEACQSVPGGSVLLASSGTCPVQMIRFGQNVYATQFHAELDYSGLALRIDYYKHKGYFPPEEAEALKQKASVEVIREPMMILNRFVDFYHRKSP